MVAKIEDVVTQKEYYKMTNGKVTNQMLIIDKQKIQIN